MMKLWLKGTDRNAWRSFDLSQAHKSQHFDKYLNKTSGHWEFITSNAKPIWYMQYWQNPRTGSLASLPSNSISRCDRRDEGIHLDVKWAIERMSRTSARRTRLHVFDRTLKWIIFSMLYSRAVRASRDFFWHRLQIMTVFDEIGPFYKQVLPNNRMQYF